MVRFLAFCWLVSLVLLGGCVRAVPAPDTMLAVPVRQVEVDGTTIACRELGSGQPLLLVMGYAGTMDVWDPVLVDRLARRYRVILFDHRGMGHSGALNGELSIELMARDALEVLEALGAEGAHVLGWSMGAMIAQEMALREPEMVGKIVLYGPTSAYDGQVRAAVDRMMGSSAKEFADMLFPVRWVSEHPGIFKRLPVPDTPAAPATVAAQRLAMEQWPGTGERLSDLHQDILLVVGDEDWVTPPGLGLDMAAELPGAWVVRFRQGGHWLMYQEPERLADVVRCFLNTDAH